MTATAEKLTISIAMTTFNGATYLEEQLDSLLGQQHLPAELVVGDDGSEDETLSILERFARKAPFPILVHRNPSRLGFRANFAASSSPSAIRMTYGAPTISLRWRRASRTLTCC
jgi:glycosyltransferase involved in cell wall biosynthesis